MCIPLSNSITSMYRCKAEVYLLAVVKDDGAVGPAVVIDHAEAREDAHAHRLQTPLVTQGEPIAAYLLHKTQGQEKLEGKGLWISGGILWCSLESLLFPEQAYFERQANLPHLSKATL